MNLISRQKQNRNGNLIRLYKKDCYKNSGFCALKSILHLMDGIIWCIMLFICKLNIKQGGNVMWIFIGVIGFLGFLASIVGTIIMLSTRDPALMKWLAALVICLVIFIVGIANDSSIDDQKSAEAYTKGMKFFTNQKYEAAIAVFAEVDQSDSHYSEVQNKIKEAKSLLAQQSFMNAKEQFANNEFKNAIASINKAIDNNPDIDGANELLNTIKEAQQKYLEQQEEQFEDNFKDSCQRISYKALEKNPDSFKYERIKLHGKIMQIKEEGNATFILLETTDMGNDIWTDNVAVLYNGKIDAYEDDLVFVWGEVNGEFSYKSQAGWDITVPGVQARYIK